MGQGNEPEGCAGTQGDFRTASYWPPSSMNSHQAPALEGTLSFCSNTLIKAFARLASRRPCRLVILGEGKEEARRTRPQAPGQRLGLAPRVGGQSIRGYVACVLVRGSSIYEGLQTVLVEALACGCPCVRRIARRSCGNTSGRQNRTAGCGRRRGGIGGGHGSNPRSAAGQTDVAATGRGLLCEHIGLGIRGADPGPCIGR